MGTAVCANLPLDLLRVWPPGKGEVGEDRGAGREGGVCPQVILQFWCF